MGFWIEIYSKDGISIFWSANCERNFYTGLTIEKEGKSVKANSSEYTQFHNLIKEVDSCYEKHSEWLGWKYSEPGLHFRAMNSKECKKLFDEAYREEITSKIASEGVKDIVKVLDGLNKL